MISKLAALRSSENAQGETLNVRHSTSNVQFSMLCCSNPAALTLQCRSLVTRRVNDVERHRQEEIANEHGEGGIDHRLGGGTPDTHCAFPSGQSFVTTDEYNEYPETKRFREAHYDVAASRPLHHVRHVIGPVNFEQKNRDEITSSNANGDALRHQQRHRNYHSQRAWHDEIIGGMNRQSTQRVNLLRYLHCPDFGRHSFAALTRHHQGS